MTRDSWILVLCSVEIFLKQSTVVIRGDRKILVESGKKLRASNVQKFNKNAGLGNDAELDPECGGVSFIHSSPTGLEIHFPTERGACPDASRHAWEAPLDEGSNCDAIFRRAPPRAPTASRARARRPRSDEAS